MCDHIIHIFLAWLTTSQPTNFPYAYIHSVLFTKMLKFLFLFNNVRISCYSNVPVYFIHIFWS